jgi:HPt (histidine-containing phosphotransfer) domain-containing protein
MSTPEKRDAIREGMRRIWERSSPEVEARIQLLEELAQAATQGGSLTPAERLAGEREAHKLAGSLGTFGFEQASRAASQLEQLLRTGEQALTWPDLIRQIREDIKPL